MNYTLPFVAAFIGWITNYIAIKMLFHPRKPVKILFMTFHGIFPKRQKAFAQKIGELVANELFSVEDIKKSILKEENFEDVNKLIDAKMDVFLKEKLVVAMPLLAMVMNESLAQSIKSTLMNEIQEIMPEMISSFSDKIQQNIDVQKTVEEKIALFSFEKLENILFSILQKEFKFIEIIGAVLGFLIGVIQLLLL